MELIDITSKKVVMRQVIELLRNLVEKSLEKNPLFQGRLWNVGKMKF
jgi:hypothetical protein